MIVRAVRLQFDAQPDDDDEPWEWEAMLRAARKNPNMWGQFLPDDPALSYEEFGKDADLMRAVASVVRAVNGPPV